MRKIRLGMPIIDDEFVDVNDDDSEPETSAQEKNESTQQVPIIFTRWD